ncbi:hypothetical protein RF11_08239 [Thelohanellus kitauei]|uniref:Secreted protein n=1 Tax=Thelohanellus kitauei TaxID=669202 RepID=A0A0C2MJ84_THEKT|nr:hypothetical protein RF11_08239 [Thelohanellus kitauei]
MPSLEGSWTLVVTLCFTSCGPSYTSFPEMLVVLQFFDRWSLPSYQSLQSPVKAAGVVNGKTGMQEAPASVVRIRPMYDPFIPFGWSAATRSDSGTDDPR